MRNGLVRLSLCVLPLVPVCSAHALDIFGQPGGSWTLPVRSIKEAKSAGTIRQEHDFSCGAAAVATLLTFHYDDRVSERDVFESMYRRGDQALIQREGFSLLDMKNYLEARGYRADGVEARLEELAQVGIPAIVLIRENGYAHFVVIKGIRNGRVLVGDPALGTRVIRLVDFKSIWPNEILFLIRDRQDMGKRRFNDRQAWAAHPVMPLDDVLSRQGLAAAQLMRPGLGDF